MYFYKLIKISCVKYGFVLHKTILILKKHIISCVTILVSELQFFGVAFYDIVRT